MYTAHRAKAWHLSSWQSSEELRKTLTHSILGLPAFPGLSEPSASLAYFIVIVPDVAERFQKSFNIPSICPFWTPFEYLLTNGGKRKKNMTSFLQQFPQSTSAVAESIIWSYRSCFKLYVTQTAEVNYLHGPLWCRPLSLLQHSWPLHFVVFKAKFKPLVPAHKGQYGPGPLYL